MIVAMLPLPEFPCGGVRLNKSCAAGPYDPCADPLPRTCFARTQDVQSRVGWREQRGTANEGLRPVGSRPTLFLSMVGTIPAGAFGCAAASNKELMCAMDDQKRTRGDTPPVRSRFAEVSGPLGGLIDWERASESTGGDAELLAEVIEAFRQEAPVLLANIQQAIIDRDAELLHRASHTIKSAFYSLGALSTGDIACELEQAGEAANFQRPVELWESLESKYRQVSQELDAFMRRHSEMSADNS